MCASTALSQQFLLGWETERTGEVRRGRDPHSFSLLVTVEAGRKRHLSTYSLAGAVQRVMGDHRVVAVTAESE